MFFKIHGERNSGTNFLLKLLKKNFNNVYGNEHGDKMIKNKYYFWKHQIPKNYTFNGKENKLVVKIFIVRKLEPWLVSMFHNPYHLKKKKDFKSFLLDKQEIDTNHSPKYINNSLINKDDQNRTIFQIRYLKYKKIREYCEKNENIILVNLDYLQDDTRCMNFLKEINDKYKLNKTNFSLINKHTKTSQDVKNIEYSTDYKEYQELIDSNKNIEYENEINNLSFYMKIQDDAITALYSNFK